MQGGLRLPEFEEQFYNGGLTALNADAAGGGGRRVATVCYPPGFAFDASDEDLMGLRPSSMRYMAGLEKAGHTGLTPCERCREGALCLKS